MNLNDRTLTLIAIALALTVLAPPAARAGGFLDIPDLTGHHPAPLPGRVIGELVPMRWDPRCQPVPFRLDRGIDPIPNPLGAPVLTLDQVTTAVEQAFASWRSIPTSFFDPQLVGTVDNPGSPRFDFVNEISFGTLEDPSLIAQVFPVALMEDRYLTAGQDLDGDSDADVSALVTACGDADGDGDFELPPGFYPAGTLLDTDMVLNSDQIRFTVGTFAIDDHPESVDLLAVLTHEVGHTLGLCHVLENQLSTTDGTGAVMFPFIDLRDPASELAARNLAEDDVAWASLAYPEGTASSGPAALQLGDQRFSSRYGLLTGSVQQGEEAQPVAGGSVAALSSSTGQVVGAGFSGRARVAVDLDTGDDDPISAAWSILDGTWQIPVRPGLYRLRLEAPDGLPVAASRINQTVDVGGRLGQLDFPEELHGGLLESSIEEYPGLAVPVVALPGHSVPTRDLVTNEVKYLGTLRSLVDVAGGSATPGTYHALRIPNAELRAAALAGDLVISAAEYLTFSFDESLVPVYAEALLAWGEVFDSGMSKTATIDLAHPLRRTWHFAGQNLDYAPYYLEFPRLLGIEVELGAYSSPTKDLFLVLRVPLSTPFPGGDGRPPVVGFSEEDPILGNSYRSADGVTFAQQPIDYLFRLVLTP
ncbi:MAG TPA: matrixin family metalloprotease [Thermoanaerobaculia bacterium]|nr:matrixin family metalloprotease [Thermoanaerobaculia bacterium]